MTIHYRTGPVVGMILAGVVAMIAGAMVMLTRGNYSICTSGLTDAPQCQSIIFTHNLSWYCMIVSLASMGLCLLRLRYPGTAGWYADPWGLALARWWTGKRWSHRTHNDPTQMASR